MVSRRGDVDGRDFLWGGLACCCAGVGCYLLGRSYDEKAAAVRSARSFCRISDLSAALGASSGYLPLVTVSGQVGSDRPIIAQLSGLKAAIVVTDVRQHFMKKQQKKNEEEYEVIRRTKEEDGTERIRVRKVKDADAEQWIRYSEEISSKRRKVPWYLDDGTGRVKIARASSADGFALSLGSRIFVKQPRSCGCEESIKILGLERIEWVLPIGRKLTVVGEAHKDDSGKILIRRPRSGGPFHVSTSSVDTIASNLVIGARWCEFWAAAFAVSGIFLLGSYATIRFIVYVYKLMDDPERETEAVKMPICTHDGQAVRTTRALRCIER